MNLATECLYGISPGCEQTISVRRSPHFTCPACCAELERQFGAGWHELPWHRELVGDARRFADTNPAGLTGVGQNKSHLVSYERAVDFVEAALQRSRDLPAAAPAPGRIAYKRIYHDIYSIYAAYGFGARRIARLLEARGDSVSLSTVQRYLRLVREQVDGGPVAEPVELSEQAQRYVELVAGAAAAVPRKRAA
jgi:hypothetical protein